VGVQGELGPAGVLAPQRLLELGIENAISPFDGADLTAKRKTTLESLAQAIQQRLSAGVPRGTKLARLELSHPDGAVSLDGGHTLYRQTGTFSAAHRTHAPRLSESENQALYGVCNNPAGHGHNYRASIWHSAQEAMPASLWAEFDHRNLSVDIPDLRGRNVVTEAIAALLAKRVPGAARARVWEMDDFFAEYAAASGAYRLGRRYRFSAAHQLGQGLDETDSRLLFGRCGRPGIHGHDFGVLILVTGQLDERTETAFDLGELDRVAWARLAPLQHADLSTGLPELAGAATPDRIASYLFDQLRRDLGPALCAVGVSALPGQWGWTAKGTHE
jgi:6-pyruvoyltetrahydropterin/6-carboxytetrahydropterin synthase